jgi:hypothetical protein
MWISVKGEVREVGQSRAATVMVDLAVRRTPADYLRDIE